MTPVNNFQTIRNLLSWENEGEYYHCQLLLRKKDGEITYGSKNNSARLIKDYQFFNIEEFNRKEKEIIGLCEEIGCRAGITLNKKTERDTGLQILKAITERVVSNNFRGINNTLRHINGVQEDKTGKIWLIDVDDKQHLKIVFRILHDMGYRKFIETVNTYNGYHVITEKFHSEQFMEEVTKLGLDVTIHKNNPVALYYPLKEKEDDNE